MIIWVSHGEGVWLWEFEVRRFLVQRADWVPWNVGILAVDVLQCSVGVLWGARREGRGGWGVCSLAVQRVFKLSLRETVRRVSVPTPLSEERCFVWIGGSPIICETNEQR